MKKAGLAISTVLFSLLLILPSVSSAHEGEHDKSSDHGKEHKQYEEGSGSSAVEPSHEGKEYKSDHHEEAEEEGSFSYRRHRKEMKEKKAMEEEHGSSHKKEEGSGSR